MAEWRRPAARVAVAAAALVLAGYVGLATLMHLRQRDLAYHPGLTRVATESTDFGLVSAGVHLRGWRLNPGRADALLYFGGNAERIEAWREPFAQWFPERTVYLLAYRGYGASGGEPDQQALLEDALALHDEVRRRHPDGDIAVVGRSLGSGVAAHLASQRPVARLALVTPFEGLADVAAARYPWLPVRWLMTERYPSADYLRDYRGRVLVLRAGRDRVVPPPNTDALLAALPQPAEVVEFPDAGHNDLALDPVYGQALAAFMR